MPKTDAVKLENDFIDEIKKVSHQKKFSSQSPLFYEGQVPVVAYLLLDGTVQLMKNKKVKKILRPGALIGLHELMTNSPAKLSAVATADSTLCFLDKSTIKEITSDENSPIAHLFAENI